MNFATVGLALSCAILGAAEKSIESGFLDALGIAKAKVIDKALPETEGAKIYREGMKLRYSQPLDSDNAFKLFKVGYDFGNADCAYELSLCYLSGVGVRMSQSKALEVLSNGMKMKDGSAIECEVKWLNLHTGSVLSLYRESNARNCARRLVALSTLNTNAAISVTELLFSDGNPPSEIVSPYDHNKAVNVLKLKAAAGDGLACLAYGKILIGYRTIQDATHPKYVKPDLVEGLRLIKLAESKHVPGAAYQLFEYYEKNDVKPVTAYEWLERAWAEGDCDAGQELSYSLSVGRGAAIDRKRATEIALKVGEQGNANQTSRIAMCFDGHSYLDLSLNNFLAMHRLAADRGQVVSADQLGTFYSGEKVPGFESSSTVSVEEAFKYFQIAAFPDGPYNHINRLHSLLYLGDMYRRGIACDSDLKKASEAYLEYLKLFRKSDYSGREQFSDGGKVRMIWLVTHYPNLPGLPGLSEDRLRFDGLVDYMDSFKHFAKWGFDYELFDDVAKVISTRDDVEKRQFSSACFHVAREFDAKDALFYLGDIKHGKNFNSESYELYKYAALSGSPSAAYRLQDMFFAQSGQPNTINAGPEFALKLSMGRNTRELVIAQGEGEAWRRFGNSLEEDFNADVTHKRRDFRKVSDSLPIFVSYGDDVVLPILRMINAAHREQLAKNAAER